MTEVPLQPRVEELRLEMFIPDAWFHDRARSSVWLRAFRVALVVGQDQLASGPRMVDIGRVRAVMFFGKFRYLDLGSWTVDLPASPEPTLVNFVSNGAGPRETPQGVWLVLLAPYAVDGVQGDEVEVRRRLESVAGLFAAFDGFNVVYESGPENIIELRTASMTGISPTFVNPYSHRVPDVTEAHLVRVANAAMKIEALPVALRNRVNLAMHWFHLAMRDQHTDAFLKRWIALEVLAMPDSANIRPISEALAAAYGMTYRAALDRFRVGRLADMRARIVHGGEPLPIHAALEHYIDAVFFDVFAQVLGEPSDRRATSVLDQAGADFWEIVIPQPLVANRRAKRPAKRMKAH